jgi:hypothetical protein
VPERPERHELAGLTAQAAPASKLAQAAGAADFSLAATVGGVRGLLESVIPFTVFSVVYGFTEDLRTSVIAALVPAAVLAAWRLIAREPLTQAVSGLIGIGIGAWVATRTGNATDFFLPNILKNAGFAALYAFSALIRWPLIGVVLGPALGEMFEWRKVPARRRAYVICTWLWVAMFGVRLAVQIPLWLADQVTLLGTLNAFVLGLPLFGLTIWLCWLVLRRVPVVKPAARAGATGPDGDEDEVRTPAERA